MIDLEVIERIEKLLVYSENIGIEEVNRRLKELEVAFASIIPQVVECTLEEKGVFLKLLTRSNDLVRRSMEHQMKALNLTPEKLDRIMKEAQHSNRSDSINMAEALGHLQTKAAQVEQSVARVNAKMSAGLQQAGVKIPSQQRLRRSKWTKP